MTAKKLRERLRQHAKSTCDLMDHTDQVKLLVQIYGRWKRVRHELGLLLREDIHNASKGEPVGEGSNVGEGRKIKPKSTHHGERQLWREYRRFSPFVDPCRLAGMGKCGGADLTYDALIAFIVAYADTGLPLLPEDVGLAPPIDQDFLVSDHEIEYHGDESEFSTFGSRVFETNARVFNGLDLHAGDEEFLRIRQAITHFGERIQRIKSGRVEASSLKKLPARGLTRSELVDALDMDPRTLASYIDKSGVHRSRSSAPGICLPFTDVITALKYVIDEGKRSKYRKNAKKLLEELNGV